MAGLPIPSYVSTVSSLPRLRGDGMESDTLKRHAVTSISSSPPNPPPQRHRNLNSSTKAATVARSQKPRHVPKEPTKGAVGQMNGLPLDLNSANSIRTRSGIVNVAKELPIETVANGGSSGLATVDINARQRNVSSSDHGKHISIQANCQSTAMSHNSQNTGGIIIKENNYHRKMSENALQEYSYNPLKNNTKLNKSNTYTGSFPIANEANRKYVSIEQPVQNSADKVSLNTNRIIFSAGPENSLQKNEANLGTVAVPYTKPVATWSGASQVNVNMDLNSSEKSDDTVITMSVAPPPEDERQVEGQSVPNEDGTKLQAQNSSIKQQLQQQVKVNADLKKLLVAAVGDDLHWKMDALINTKTQLASEIGSYTEKIENDYEELDRLSIHADMWRSKFMATRVLIDQLASDKEKSSVRWSRAERALQQLMQERQQMHESLVETHRFLKLLRDSFDPVFARKTESVIPNILELARTNLLLSESVKFKLLGSLPVLSVALDAGVQNGLSPAEKIAYQVLMDDSMESSGFVTAPGRLSADTLHHFGRFHPQVRYEGISCSSCRNCRGEIHVI